MRRRLTRLMTGRERRGLREVVRRWRRRRLREVGRGGLGEVRLLLRLLVGMVLLMVLLLLLMLLLLLLDPGGVLRVGRMRGSDDLARLRLRLPACRTEPDDAVHARRGHHVGSWRSWTRAWRHAVDRSRPRRHAPLLLRRRREALGRGLAGVHLAWLLLLLLLLGRVGVVLRLVGWCGGEGRWGESDEARVGRRARELRLRRHLSVQWEHAQAASAVPCPSAGASEARRRGGGGQRGEGRRQS